MGLEAARARAEPIRAAATARADRRGRSLSERQRRFNELALELLPACRAKVAAAKDPLELAARLAIAGNIIDFGANGGLREPDVRRSLSRALSDPFAGDLLSFRADVTAARRILYLADNAGEIVFDRLLIEQLPAGRVTVAVRGVPVLNDATLAARAWRGWMRSRN